MLPLKEWNQIQSFNDAIILNIKWLKNEINHHPYWRQYSDDNNIADETNVTEHVTLILALSGILHENLISIVCNIYNSFLCMQPKQFTNN